MVDVTSFNLTVQPGEYDSTVRHTASAYIGVVGHWLGLARA